MSKKLTEAPTVKVGSASTSSTEACRDSSIPSYIGWMFLSESCTNSASWCSTACTSDENKVIRIAKCDVFSGVCESIR